MKYAFLVVGFLAMLVGLAMAAMAKGAIHEIEAGIAFLIFAVMMGAVGIMGALDRLREEQIPLLRIIAGVPAGWACPECRTQNPTSTVACGKCGHRIA